MPENLKVMLDHFEQWQCGPQGGGNKLVTANQHAEMTKRLLIEMKAWGITEIMNDNKLWKLFLKKTSGKFWTGLTTRGFIVAMKKFMNFIIKDGREGKYTNLNFSRTSILE